MILDRGVVLHEWKENGYGIRAKKLVTELVCVGNECIPIWLVSCLHEMEQRENALLLMGEPTPGGIPHLESEMDKVPP